MRPVVFATIAMLASSPALADLRSQYQTMFDQAEYLAGLTKKMVGYDRQLQKDPRDHKCDLFTTYNRIVTSLLQDLVMAESGQEVSPWAEPHAAFLPTKDEIIWMKLRLIHYQGEARNYEGYC